MAHSFRCRPALPRLLALPALLLACGRLGYDLIDEVEVGAAGPDAGSGATSSAGNGAATGSGQGASASGGSGASSSGGTTAGAGADGGGGADMAGAPSGGALAGNGGEPGAAGAGSCGSGEICDGLDSDCSCSDGCDGYTYDGHAYAFCSTARSRADAASDCAAMGMQLVRIDDEPENTWVSDLIASYGGTNNTRTGSGSAPRISTTTASGCGPTAPRSAGTTGPTATPATTTAARRCRIRWARTGIRCRAP